MLYVHDFSLMNALGNNNEEILKNLALNQSVGMRRSSEHLVGCMPAVFGCVDVPEFKVPERLSKHQSRNNRLLIQCYNNRKAHFDQLLSQYRPERVAVILGTSTSGSEEADVFTGDYLNNKASDFHGYCQELGDPSRFMSAYLQLNGPNFTISTACTSSTRTFISAQRLINAGVIDAAIVGGADTLARMPINGFNALGALSTDLCRPFAKNRHGITIGEAAGLFFVSSKPSAIALLGYGESSDGYHMTAPIPDGSGAKEAMQQALASAQLKPEDIAYLNLHGTGTMLNDEAESNAVSELFTDGVTCTSTKNLTGHTLGAAGATEAGLICLLQQSPDFVISGQGLSRNDYEEKMLSMGLAVESKTIHKGPMMTNNFAFGGNNASLIFGTV